MLDSPRKRRFKYLSSISLLAGVVVSHAGCVYIPHKLPPFEGDAVGGMRSDRPIRVGYSSRDDVIRQFGSTEFRTDDNRRLAYGSVDRSGTVVWLLLEMLKVPGATYPREVTRAIVLTFDDAGILRSFERGRHIPEDLKQASYTRWNRKLWADAAAEKAATQPK